MEHFRVQDRADIGWVQQSERLFGSGSIRGEINGRASLLFAASLYLTLNLGGTLIVVNPRAFVVGGPYVILVGRIDPPRPKVDGHVRLRRQTQCLPGPVGGLQHLG